MLVDYIIDLINIIEEVNNENEELRHFIDKLNKRTLKINKLESDLMDFLDNVYESGYL